MTKGKWEWKDKSSIGNFKWSLWANQDQFAAYSNVSGKLEGVEGQLIAWVKEHGYDEYYKQFYIGSDELGYDYECFELDDVESKLKTYGGAMKNLFDEDDTINYITPYTKEKQEKTYKTKVVIDVNGGTLESKDDNTYYLKAGESVKLPTDMTKSGYNFAGWKKVESFSDNGNAVYGEPVKDVTVEAGDGYEVVYYTAQWNIITYTLSFDSMGGSDVSPIENIPFGSKISAVGGLPTDPVRDGFSFQGWYYRDAETGAYSTKVYASDAVKGNTTVYAKWRATKVDVIFNSNGGSSVDTMKGVAYNSTITLPEAPTRKGCTFLGWYYDEALTKEFKSTTKIKETLSSTINESGTLTLYAKWDGEPAPETVTLSFDTAGGTTIEAVSVTPGAAVGELPTPVKAEYVFAGWYAEAGCTTEFTTSSAIEADATIYAKWALKGDVDDNKEVTAEDALMVLKRVANMISDSDLTAIQKKQADVDANGDITAEDALMILKRVANMITGFDS